MATFENYSPFQKKNQIQETNVLKNSTILNWDFFFTAPSIAKTEAFACGNNYEKSGNAVFAGFDDTDLRYVYYMYLNIIKVNECLHGNIVVCKVIL